MIDALRQSLELIFEHFLDGFLAVLAIAVAAPLLGCFLVLRRIPLLGLAIPQMAGCGQAAAFFVFALGTATAGAVPPAPGEGIQLLGAFAGVVLGLAILFLVGRDRRFVGVQAGILFLVAIAGQQLLYLESPYSRIFEEAAKTGRLLTVMEAGRNRILWTSAAIVLVTTLGFRRLWISAFDAEQARLLGMRPRASFLATLLLIGALSGLCVPVVGPEVVLTLLLIPPALLRRVAPSLRSYAPLSILAGLGGATAAFVLACTEEVDWPPTPALVLCVVLASWIVALPVAAWRWLRSR